MKKSFQPPKRRHLLMLILFGLMLLPVQMFAQQAISIIWDSETGCLVYNEKERKYEEDIADGPCVRVCEYSTVTYSLTGNNGTWQSTVWSVAGGTISSSSTGQCVVNWASSGNATVMAEITKQDGTVHTEEICVEIIKSPTAALGVAPFHVNEDVTVCEDQDLYFVNYSSTNGGTELISYYWDFGDGNTSSEFQPTHSYDSYGDYEVTLTVTNACNCTSTQTIKVHVKKSIGVEITCPGVVCDGSRAQYSINEEAFAACKEAGSSFEWSVEGGHIVSPQPYGGTIEVVWDSVDEAGFGYVTFNPGDCNLECAVPTTVKVPVIQTNGTITGAILVCEDEQNIYKLPQWPSTDFTWTLQSNGTGANLIETPLDNEVVVDANNAGTLILSATYYNTLLGCGGTAEIEITVRPRAIIDGPTAMCINTLANYNLQGGYSGNWTLTGPGGTQTGTGNSFSKNFTVAGTYTLAVTGTTFCKPTQLSIIVRPKEATPTAIIGPANACPGVPETYSVNNTIAGTVIGWEVVNGTIAGDTYGNEITVTFGPTGPYIVRAWRESNGEPNCISNKISKTITLPVVNPTITGPDVVCASSYADYTTNYTQGELYEWTIEPATAGSVSQGNGTENITVLWNQLDIIDAKLILKVTKCGAITTKIFLVDVVTVPPVSLVNPVTEICRGTPFNLQMAGITSGVATWNFGDGSPNVVSNNPSAPVTHTYTNINGSNTNYTVTVTVANPNGCITSANLSHQITVVPAPVASITPGGTYAVCDASDITDVLFVNIQGGFGATDDIEWFHNGAPISGTFDNQSINLGTLGLGFGQYHAVVTNGNDCSTTTNVVTYYQDCNGPVICTITPTPTLSVSASNNCGVVSATGSASGSPTSRQWISQPAAQSQTTTATTAQFTYAESGIYRIFYLATYGNCTTSKYTDVLVPYKPHLKYNITCGSTPGTYTVTLLDHSNYHPTTPITNYKFYVDGSLVSNGSANSFPVNLTPGNHTLKLTVQRSGYPACSTGNINLNLPDMPSADFTYNNPTCEDAVVNFTASQAGLTYFWDFADGSANVQKDPDKVYVSSGTYNVKLMVTNQYGCTDTVIKTVNIITNKLEGEISANPASACEGNSVVLNYNNYGSMAPVVYKWMKGTDLVGTTAVPTFNATQPGSYWVSVESSQGCVLNTSNRVNVTFIKPAVAHISGPTEVCHLSNFTLSNPQSPAGTLITWTKNGSPLPAFNNLSSISDSALAITTYTYTVTVKVPDGLGGYCTTTDSHTVTVKPTPGQPSINMSVLDCNTYTFKLTASASGAGTYTWSNGMTGQSIIVNQGGAYQVRFTNIYGCSSTRQIEIPKDPAIHLWNVPVGCYTLCKDVLQGGVLQGTIMAFPYWEWLFNGSGVAGGSNSAVADLSIAPTGSGTYQLLLNNGYCDRVSNEVNITQERCIDCRLRVDLKKLELSNKRGFCSYLMELYIGNPTGVPIQITLTAPNGEGVFSPSTITVNPGGTGYLVEFIPFSPFNGGDVIIALEGMVEGKTCYTQITLRLPECTRQKSLPSDGSDDEALADGYINKLIVSPNPTRDVVALDYSYGQENGERSIEVYSIMGILLETHNPQQQKGTWNLNMGQYAAGSYVVVMKENGMIIMQKNLIKQ